MYFTKILSQVKELPSLLSGPDSVAKTRDSQLYSWSRNCNPPRRTEELPPCYPEEADFDNKDGDSSSLSGAALGGGIAAASFAF